MERIQKTEPSTANTGLEKKRKMAYKLAELLEGHTDEARWMLQPLTGARQSEVLEVSLVRVRCAVATTATVRVRPPTAEVWVRLTHQKLRVSPCPGARSGAVLVWLR